MAGAILEFLNKEFNFEFEAKPNFLSEAIFAVLVVIVYKCMLRELRRIGKRFDRKKYPYTDKAGSYSTESICGDSICTDSDFENKYCCCDDKDDEAWPVQPKEQVKPHLMTPKEYVRLDKEQQMKQNKLKGCMVSLTTLFKNVTSNSCTKEHRVKLLEQAREDAACASMAKAVTKNMDLTHVTDSYIDVLGEFAKQSDGASLPLKGNMAEMLYEIGDLGPKRSTNCGHIAASVDIESKSRCKSI